MISDHASKIHLAGMLRTDCFERLSNCLAYTCMEAVATMFY